MPQQIIIPVRLDARTFRRYCAFDALKRQRRWYWPALTSMLLVTAALAGLFGWIPMSAALSGLLMGLGLAVVMLNAGLYLLNVESQVARQRLKDRPLVYTLSLGQDCLRVTSGQSAENAAALPWDGLWAAFANRGDIYVYVNPEKALILPEGAASVPTDALKSCLKQYLGKGRCVNF